MALVGWTNILHRPTFDKNTDTDHFASRYLLLGPHIAAAGRARNQIYAVLCLTGGLDFGTGKKLISVHKVEKLTLSPRADMISIPKHSLCKRTAVSGYDSSLASICADLDGRND